MVSSGSGWNGPGGGEGFNRGASRIVPMRICDPPTLLGENAFLVGAGIGIVVLRGMNEFPGRINQANLVANMNELPT